MSLSLLFASVSSTRMAFALSRPVTRFLSIPFSASPSPLGEQCIKRQYVPIYALSTGVGSCSALYAIITMYVVSSVSHKESFKTSLLCKKNYDGSSRCGDLAKALPIPCNEVNSPGRRSLYDVTNLITCNHYTTRRCNFGYSWS